MPTPDSGTVITPSTAVRQLLDDPPQLHGTVTFSLVEGALRWVDSLPHGLRTLETGCGLSTIVFMLRGDTHICITPDSSEPAAVVAYCEAHDISTERLTTRIERSELVLPTLDAGPLDLVLIDGSHAFPQVFVDYIYTAAMLRVGGTLIVDDVHLWTGSVLRQFLESEPEWRTVEEWDGRTVAFEKLAEPPSRDWFEQPFVVRRSSPWLARSRMAAAMIRRGEFDALGRYARDVLSRH
jgi:hypothetical protein